MRALNLFAGAGGWEEGAKPLGLDIHGLEHDATIATTAISAGHATTVCDVAEFDPHNHVTIDGLIASPPCQAYSTAGKGKGRADKPIVTMCLHELALGNDTRAERRAQCQDDRSLLTVEPMRFIVALRPTWVALEQVPPVLELWSVYAELLGQMGYHVDTGVLSAEQYGVPQTRKRAILVAHRDRPVKLPEPTHSRYYPRSPEKLDPGVAPWRSMAEALGWDGGVLRSNYSDGSTGDRGFRDSEAPCFAVTSKAGRMNWVHERPATTVNGDPRISRPGRHDPASSGSQQRDAVRVTVQEAAVLQSFPADYPWQGPRTKQFLQVGNAIPPLLAYHVLKELI